MKKTISTILLALLCLATATAAVTEQQADQVISRLKEIYASPFLEATFKDLVFFKDFRKFEKRAYIEEKSLFFRITLEKGLLNAKETTSDSLALILCHEVGHALGGAPFKKSKTIDQSGETITTMSWSSAEGQADYYATSICMKKYFENDYNSDFLHEKNIPSVVEVKCLRFQDKEKENICKRTALAILPALEIINDSKTPISFSTPDQTNSEATLLSYPSLQCRLDTYLNGAAGDERPRCWYLPGNEGNASWKF